MTNELSQDEEAFLGASEKMSNELIDTYELSFACQDGMPQSTHREGTKSYPYVSYAYGHNGVEDKRAELVEKFTDLANRLKAAGATRIVWRSKPRFIHDALADGSDVRTILRGRFAAIARDGSEVRVQETAEGQELAWLKDSAPKSETLETLTEAAVVNPVLGYDLVKVTDEAVLHCAAVLHAAIKALNDFRNEPTLTFEESRDSTVAGIRNFLKNPGMTPEDQHNAWLEHKRADGWKYGVDKDPVAKTHPCFIPYRLLPDSQRVKDYVFQGVIRAYFGDAEIGA